MSIESVKKYFADNKLSLEVIEPEADTSTVEKAAQAIGVEPDMIAKTLAFQLKDRNILIVTKGGARTNNKKFKSYFKEKAKFVAFEDVEAVTGHPVLN